MATGLESAFDQQEGEDVFAVEEGASTGYGSLQEALAAGQEAYDSYFDEDVEKIYNKLSQKEKDGLDALEQEYNTASGRDKALLLRTNKDALKYLALKKNAPEITFNNLQYDHSTSGRRREDIDYYGDDSPFRAGADAQAEVIQDYLKDNNIPLYKELEDGTRLYLTTGTSAHYDEHGKQDLGIGKFVEAGEVGTYSTYFEPRPDRSFFDGMLANPFFRTALAVATGGQSELYITAAKGISGETLHAGDWATLVTGGMQKAGIGTPIQQAGVNAAITGDPSSLITEVVGGDNLTTALETIGIPQSLLDDPDFMSGVEEAIGTVAGGGNIQDALESGLTEYVKEGGGFGVELPDAPDIDIDLGAIGDVVSNIASGVRDVGSQIGDVTDPLLSTIGDVGSATEDVVRDVGSSIADAAEPFKEPVETIGRGIDDYLLQPVKDALLTGGGALVAQPSGTRTTDGLFSSELFKFSPVEFTDVGRIQPRQAPQELVEDIDSNPFASDFDNRNLFG